LSLPTVFLLAAALGTDAFSMAVGIGITGIRKKHIVLISAVICFFHILMPLIGLSLGAVLGRAIGRVARIVGASVLIVIGVQSFGEVVNKKRKMAFTQSESKLRVMSGFWGLVILAGSVSLDALTVGFGLGTFNFNLPVTVGIFGAVAGVMTAGGFVFGRRIGGWLGNRAEMVGGLILAFIGVKMLIG